MRGRNTIVINGKLYDAVSGLPVAAPDIPAPRPEATKPKPHKAFADIGPAIKIDAARPQHHTATHVHRTIQKSQTLRREALKRPAGQHIDGMRRKPAIGHVAKSNMVSKFAPHPQPRTSAVASQKAASATQVIAPHSAASQVSTPEKSLDSRQRKEKLIADRLAKIDHHRTSDTSRTPKRGFFASRHPRVSSIVAACIALVLLGGYLTYLNMPNLSVRVAAAQAGVNASFPQYHPDGYRFDGPIAYSAGEVNINFQSNGGPQRFTIKQKSSNWDSQAVLDNYVAKKSNNQYITSSESGLTIYTFDNQAAWVNKGVFYSIDGDAPLSSEQVLHIASSM